ncbi:MAG: MFS transporter [Asgard group archaeon]|nr:MFS transporter [Asgard group archaeon]
MTDTHHESSITSTILTNGSTLESPSTIEVLRNRTFMLLLMAQFTQNIGAAVSWLALQFLLFKLTGSPGIMGILSIVFFLPFVLFTPFAGVFVDRFDQRKIMLLSNLISFIASVGYIIIYFFLDKLLIIELIPMLTETGKTVVEITTNPIHVIWPMFILTFLNSTASSVFFPSRSAYTRLIVKKKNLLIANSFGSSVFQVATIIGYVLAGVIAGRSYLGSFIFDASTFAFSLSMIILILILGKKPPDVIRVKEETFRAQVKGVVDDLKIGYKTIREAPKISYMLMVFAATIFSFSAFNVLFIVVLQREMGLNETWYGILQSIMGISGIITSLILMRIGSIKRKVMMLNIALLMATMFLWFFGFTRNAYAMGVILFVFGIALVMINISAPTLIQEQIPYEKQGRVFGTQQLFQGVARIIGMGIVSVIAEYVQPMYIIFISAGLLTIMMIWGIIYSNRSGISGDDYADQNSEITKKHDTPLNATDAEDSYTIIDPEPSLD